MTTAALLSEMLATIERQEPVAAATVVQTSRSVPRHAGSMMLVFADGSQSGTVGGGEMESRVIKEALDALDDHKPRFVTYELVDPGKGDPGVCGGSVDVYIEPHSPPRQLVVVGCGHVGAAVVHLAHWLGFEVVATDDRDAPEIAAAVAAADTFVAGTIDDLLDAVEVRPGAAIVVVSRNMGVDLAALPRLLETPASYIGVMGSLRRWRGTRQKLVELGTTDEAIGRLTAPLGLELNAETPEEIAISILAEVIGHQRGGDGGPMRDTGAE